MFSGSKKSGLPLFPGFDWALRRNKIHQVLDQQGIDAFLCRHLPQIRYVSGFTGSAGLAILSPSVSILLVDSRYTAQAKEETNGFEVREIQGSLEESISQILRDLQVGRVGFDAERTSVSSLSRMKEKAPRKTQWLAQDRWLDDLRSIKDQGEIFLLQKAAQLASKACYQLIQWIKPGCVELDIVAELEYWMRKQGAERLSFDPIIASGRRSSFPHSRASRKKIPLRGWVVVDFGALFHGYSSDMTRTFHLGRPGREEIRCYQAVREAQDKAIQFLRVNQGSDEPYRLVKKLLKRRKLDTYFTHGLGHGIGLELHEPPSLSYKGVKPLSRNMVVTVEPGVYIPNRLGIRIEDMVRITSGGAKLLTDFTRELLIL